MKKLKEICFHFIADRTADVNFIYGKLKQYTTHKINIYEISHGIDDIGCLQKWNRIFQLKSCRWIITVETGSRMWADELLIFTQSIENRDTKNHSRQGFFGIDLLCLNEVSRLRIHADNLKGILRAPFILMYFQVIFFWWERKDGKS